MTFWNGIRTGIGNTWTSNGKWAFMDAKSRKWIKNHKLRKNFEIITVEATFYGCMGAHLAVVWLCLPKKMMSAKTEPINRVVTDQIPKNTNSRPTAVRTAKQKKKQHLNGLEFRYYTKIRRKLLTLRSLQHLHRNGHTERRVDTIWYFASRVMRYRMVRTHVCASNSKLITFCRKIPFSLGIPNPFTFQVPFRIPRKSWN